MPEDFTSNLEAPRAEARVNPYRKAVRYDPRHRHADGHGIGNGLINPEPDRVYALIRSDDQLMGPDYYEALGYEVERHWKGGPKLRIGPTAREGEPIMFMGSVLMSIDKKMHQDLVERGAFGGGGQQAADKTEGRIIAKDGGPDHIRGIRNRYITVQNEVQPTTTEYGS